MDQQTYLLVEMQFYISVMFVVQPEEKPSSLDFEKKLDTDRRTDLRTDGQTLI